MTVLAFTRPDRRLGESRRMAEEMGFTVLCAPSLSILPGDPDAFRSVAEKIVRREFDLMIFTSSTAVEECIRMSERPLSEIVEGTETMAIGSPTSSALKNAGIEVSDIPDEYSSEGIVEHLGDSVAGKKVLLIRSDRGSPILRLGLNSNGAETTELISYRLEQAAMSDELVEMISQGSAGRIDVFAFTSPLSARFFIRSCEERAGKDATRSMMRNSLVAAIGDPTASELTSLGFKVDVIPERSTFKDMLLEIMKETER